MHNVLSMSQRLKSARLRAGYNSASIAIKKHGFASSKYRAHENGQNKFSVKDAEIYAACFNVSASWLLIGDREEKINDGSIYARAITNDNAIHESSMAIYLLAQLLVEDPQNIKLLQKIKSYIDTSLNSLIQNIC